MPILKWQRTHLVEIRLALIDHIYQHGGEQREEYQERDDGVDLDTDDRVHVVFDEFEHVL